MSNALVQYNEGFAFTQEQINVIKSQIAKGATDDELKMFTTIASKYGLDPFLKEIWFIKSVKKQKDSRGNWDYPRLKDGTIDYSKAETLIFTSRDGYLKVAQRDPSFMGILSMAVCEGDHFEIDAENYKVTHKFGAKRGKIIGAWAKVDHAKRKPVISYVPIQEYFGEKSTTWKQYPTAMIIKVAEVLALKRQFGISGLVTKEEMSHTLDDITPDSVIDGELMPIEPEEKPEYVSYQMLQVMFKEAQQNITVIKEVMDEFGYTQSKEIQMKDYDAMMGKIKEKLPKTVDEIITPKQLKMLHTVSNSNKQLVDDTIRTFGYESSKDIKQSDFEFILQIVKDGAKPRIDTKTGEILEDNKGDTVNE